MHNSIKFHLIFNIIQSYVNYLSLGSKICFNNQQNFFTIEFFVSNPNSNCPKATLKLLASLIGEAIRCQKAGIIASSILFI